MVMPYGLLKWITAITSGLALASIAFAIWGFGEKFDGVGAEGFGLDVEAGRFQCDGEFADAGDFVGAGIGGESGGIDFDEGVLGGAIIGPAVFLGDGAEDFFGEFAAAVGVGHDGEALAGVGVGLDVAAEAFVGAAVAETRFVAIRFEAEAETPGPDLMSEHLA